MRHKLLVLACFAGAVSRPAGGAESAAGPASARRIAVVTTAAARRTFEERVVVQGNVEAKNVALVPARLKATITALYVDEGDVVKAGETRLLQTAGSGRRRVQRAREGSQRRASERRSGAQTQGLRAPEAPA